MQQCGHTHSQHHSKHALRCTTIPLFPAAAGDRSRAGGVDAPIRDLIELLNRHPHLYTTSSCSGRITVFAAPDAGTRAAKKKGGEWVFASHERVTYAQVREAGAAAASHRTACAGAELCKGVFFVSWYHETPPV